jgi:transposase-like protein
VRRGRPILYTDEKAEIAIKATGNGATRKAAARLAGVSGETLQKWIRDYPEFRRRIRESDAADEATVVMQLRTHFPKEWRAIAYYLDRRHQWQMRSESAEDSAEEQGELVVGRTDGAAIHVHAGASVEDVRASVGLESDLPPAPSEEDEEPEPDPKPEPEDDSGGLAYHVADSQS